MKAYHHFIERAMPGFGDTKALEGIKFDEVCYYLRSSDATEKDWDDVPMTFETPSTGWAYQTLSRNGSLE